MKKALIILLLLMIRCIGFGQIWENFYDSFPAKKADSIVRRLPDLENKALASAYVELARLHCKFDYDRSIHYAILAADVPGISEEELHLALMYKGEAEYLIGNYVDAIKNLSMARQYFDKTDNHYLLAELYGTLGLAFHYSQIKPEIGHEMFIKTHQASIKAGYKRGEAYSYFLLGRFLLDSLRIDEALIYFEKAAEIFVNQNHGTNHDKALSWILIGDCYRANLDCRKTREYYLKGHEWLDTAHVADCSLLSQNHSAMGVCYSQTNQIDSALKFFKAGLYLANKVGNAFFAEVNHEFLARLYHKLNNIPAAITHYQAALENAEFVVKSGHLYRNPAYRHLPGHPQEITMHLPLACRIHFQRQRIMEINYQLYLIFLQQRDYKNALTHFQAYAATNDTIQQVLKRKDMEELGYVFETEHKDQKINFLEQQNQLKESKARQTMIIFFGTSMILLLAIFALILLLRQGKLRSRQHAVELKQKLLRSQMNPHFIFNSIASIQNKIISDKPEIAADYLARFSHLFRNILEGSIMEFILLDEEIATVNNYLELQQLRYPGTFSYDIMVDEQLDTEEIHIPPMFSQPFIENAIEHGVRHKETAGKISVRYWRQNGCLRVEIEDDGIGRKKARERQMKSGTDHKSHATNITLERIAILNRRKKKKITMDILDVKDDKGAVSGTKVVFNFPG
jgi:tetratricopeptide (TPR) repeat protein